MPRHHDPPSEAAGIGDAKILLPQYIARDSIIHVRALLTHPMLTGLGRDAEGKLIPAYYVQRVIVTYGADEVARFEWTSVISRDPYVAFPLRATREAPLVIAWTDNHGQTFQGTAEVKFS